MFEKKKSTLATELSEVLGKIPDTTYVIIVEQSCDKRTKLYKAIKKIGTICEFAYLGEGGELIKYIARSLGQFDKKIDSRTASYLINHVGGDQLTLLNNEIEKLANYVGTKEVIEVDDINEICQKKCREQDF